KKPGGGTNPGDDKKPGGGTNPGDDKKPGGGTNPGDDKKPGNDTEPGGSTKPGDDTEPGGGTTPGGDKNPSDGTNPEEGDPPIISVIIEGGKIVIGGGNTTDGGDSATGNAPGMAGEPVFTGTANGLTTARTILQMYDGGGSPTGRVSVTVVCEERAYTAGVADTVAVANAVLKPEQLQFVQDGGTIEIRINVTDISENVPPQDKEVIEEAAEAYRDELPGLTLGMCIDISMMVRIGEGDWNTVTKSDEPVEIVIGIPETLQEDGRAYYIIRAHDGEYTLLDDRDDTADTVTISTDRFSSYAVAYRQTDGADAGKCGLCHICPTFLGICYFIWLAVILIAIVIVILLGLRRKKEEEKEGENG
ncbi:MAG: hypothetical protein K2M20_05620, partial [Lachnospiraceae bacterium]|nr:hypothetical protein [Lachnospiraceae bacterium]